MEFLDYPIRVLVDITQVGKLKGIVRAVQDVNKGLSAQQVIQRRYDAAMTQTALRINAARIAHSDLSQTITEARPISERQRRDWAELEKTYRKNTTTMQGVNRESIDVRESARRIMGELPKVDKAVETNIGTFTRLRGGLTQVGDKLGWLQKSWKKMGLFFLATIGPLFLVDAALRVVRQALDWVFQPFIKFEDALYSLRKTANLTAAEMLDVGAAVTDLSVRVPIAADELAKIAAIAGQLGIRGRENILSFTETIAKMATATELTADDAAKALAKIRQAFGLPIDRIEYLGSVINELENTTAATSREIVAAMERIGAAGKMLGFTAEEAAAMSSTLIAAGMGGERAGCVDEKTEIFTKDGWKNIDTISENDFIATLSPEGYLDYLQPKFIYRRNWNGKMIHFHKGTSDILVTPDHRMYVRRQWKQYYEKIEARKLLHDSNFKIPATAKWDGTNMEYFILPEIYTAYNGKKIKTFETKKVKMEDWVRFMGYFLSEGSILQSSAESGRITLSQSDAHPVTKIKMMEACDRIGYPAILKSDKIHFVINNKQLFTVISEFLNLKAHQKYVPEYIKNLSPYLLQIFLDAYREGDGHQDKRYPLVDSGSVFSSSEKMIADLTEICLKCGYRITAIKVVNPGEFFIRGKSYNRTHSCYGIHYSRKGVDHHFKNYGNYKLQVHEEEYNGRIYCPILPPYETIFIKRNGKTAWICQTRLRAVFSEMAKKIEKVADTVGVSASQMRRYIEEDPMKALMMYLEKLHAIETRTKRVEEAFDTFGRVGGFAIATLAESYPELIKNLEAARHEIVWGTSLQREFQIATTKTSAELQILTNRAEAARREIGENFIPYMVSAKSALVSLYEAVALLSKGFNVMRGETIKGDTAMDALIERRLELRELIEMEKLDVEDTRNTMKELNRIGGVWVSPRDLIRMTAAIHDVGEESRITAEYQRLGSQINDMAKVSLEHLYSTSKKQGMLEDDRFHNLKNYNLWLENEDEMIRKIRADTIDQVEEDKKVSELIALKPQLFKKAVKEMIAYDDETKIFTKGSIESAAAVKNLKLWEEDEIKSKEKGTETTIDATEATNLLTSVLEDYEDELKELLDITKDLWQETESMIGVYEKQYDLYIDLEKAERGMPKWAKRRLAQYEGEMQAILGLINESKRLGNTTEGVEKQRLAAEKATELYYMMSTEGVEDMTLGQKLINQELLDYFKTWVKYHGVMPSEIQAAENSFQKMMEVVKTGIYTIFEELPAATADIGVDAEYFRASLAELEPVPLKIEPEIIMPTTKELIGAEFGKLFGEKIVPEGQKGGFVQRTGLYRLHEGEKVLPKKEVTEKTLEDRSMHVNINRIALSEGYDMKKLLNDIEIYKLSRL